MRTKFIRYAAAFLLIASFSFHADSRGQMLPGEKSTPRKGTASKPAPLPKQSTASLPVPPSQPAYPQPAYPQPGQRTRTPVKEVVTTDGKVNFYFDDADIFDVTQIVFGEILKVSYIVDPKLKGWVNLRTAKPISIDEVLPLMEKVLKINGIGLIFEEGLYKIVPLSEIPSEVPKVFVYPVQNSKAKDVMAILQQIFGGAGQAKAKPVSAKGLPSEPASEAMVSETTKIISDDVTNSLIILSTPEDYRIIEETIKRIDIVPRQVLLEGFIAEVSLTDNMSLGFAWSLKSDVGLDLKGTMGQNLSDLAAVNIDKPGGAGFSLFATDPDGVVRARLEALSRTNKVKLLASPHVLVSDNREARIQVGQQVPIVTSETPVTGTSNIQRTIQYRDVGIILRVKPMVNEGGLVSLDITQEVSFVSGQVEGTTEVVLDKTEATTNLVSQDGHTIIIGGLIREDTSRDRSGIPYLSKIPILGYLFGRTTDNKSRKELIILLTPHVVRNLEEAGKVTSGYIDEFKKTSESIELKGKVINATGR